MKKVFLFSLLIVLIGILMVSCSEDKKTNPDTQSPSVVIAYPPNNSSFVSGTIINIVSEADDNEEVDNVKFYIDGVNSYEDSNEPYEYSWDTTDLSGSHTIYAKATDNSDNTATSDIVTVIITDSGEAPNPPTNPNPQSGATNISINTTLSWTCNDPNGDPLTYDVYFGTTANPPLVSSDLTVTNYNPGTLNETTIYYWYIKAIDTDNNSTLGPLWNFTTSTGGGGNPPNSPSNPNPSDNATDVSIDTNLSWTCTDPDGDPLTYDVYFGTSSNPSLVISGQSGTTYDPGTLNEGTTYYWKIKAYDDHSNNTIGDVWEFETDNNFLNLEIIGNCTPNNRTYSVEVIGNTAYLSDHWEGLQIVDVTNNTSPSTIASYTLSSPCYGISVENNIACIANQTNGLKIFDVSNPNNPELLSTYPSTYGTFGVNIRDNYVFIADGNNFKIVDISNPSNPILISTRYCGAYSIYILDNYAYVSGDSYSLTIFNISDLNNPSSVGSFQTGGYAQNVYVNDNYAFIADSGYGLQIIDVSNPTNPNIISTCAVEYAQDVFVDDNYAYVADKNNGLKIVDISNIAAPEIIGEIELSSLTMGIYVTYNIIYIANHFNGLQIVQIVNELEER